MKKINKYKQFKTRKLSVRKPLSGGELDYEEGLKSIESLGFEVEFHNLRLVHIKDYTAMANGTEIPAEIEIPDALYISNNTIEKGTEIIKINNGPKNNVQNNKKVNNTLSLTADSEEKSEYKTNEKFCDIYNFDENVLLMSEFINHPLRFDCEFHSLYTNLSNQGNINIIKLFNDTVIKINDWLTKLEKSSFTCKGGDLTLYKIPKTNYGFIPLNENKYYIDPQLTVGIELSQVETVLNAYFNNTGITQLNTYWTNVKNIHELLFSLFFQKIQASDNRRRTIIGKYNGVYLRNIMLLFAIHIQNSIDTDEFDRNTHIRLRYSIGSIIKDVDINDIINAMHKDSQFMTVFLKHFSKINEIKEKMKIFYAIKAALEFIPSFPEKGNVKPYDSSNRIVLLELRSFKYQLNHKINISKADWHNKDINVYLRKMKEYIQAKAQTKKVNSVVNGHTTV